MAPCLIKHLPLSRVNMVFPLAKSWNSVQCSEMQAISTVRLDKWLWAVRLYKSRSLAIQACQGGHVKIAGHRIKPSRELRPGEVITALTGRVHRTVKVLALLEQRVGAPRVPEFLEDLTPPEEYAR